MSLNFATVKTLFRTELRMVLRDRRMVLASIVLPLLVTPLMFLGSTWSVKHYEKKLARMLYHYAVTGSQAPEVRSLLEATRQRLEARGRKESQPEVFRFEESPCQDPDVSLKKGDINLILEGLTAAEALRLKQAPERDQNASRESLKAREGGELDEEETPLAGTVVVRIIFRGDNHESAAGLARMREALSETRSAQRAELLQQRGFPLRAAEVASIAETDLASKSQVAGLALGRTLTVLLLLFILSSGAIVAIDSLAGEKERGTLETLLTTSAGRLEILTAKHLVILVVALAITAIQIANLLVYIGLKWMPVPANLAAAVTVPVGLLLFVLYLPMAALAANVLLLVSGYARSYKEAQMYFLPVVFLGLVPALAPLLPGVPLRSAIVLVPVANIAFAAREILIGVFDWPMIAVSWLVTALVAVWTGRFGVRFLLEEKLITTAETDVAEFAGGPALFERRVLRWFAILWALLLLISNYTDRLDLRLQVIINLVGLFFGASVLMMRQYHLDPRAALALRAPHPAVWLGVLLAAPGGLLTALGIFRLANLVLPAPSWLTESFSEAVMPRHIPFLQVLLFLTVLPGIFEELTFRGLLLHGLRRRLRPAFVALVVGLVFGIFHVALFRFVPTACLGIMFAAVTLLTGSIFPAMLWHCLSNGLGLLAYRLKFPETDLDPICYLGGAGMLAIAFWIFWRHRTPYPGLKGVGRHTPPV